MKKNQPGYPSPSQKTGRTLLYSWLHKSALFVTMGVLLPMLQWAQGSKGETIVWKLNNPNLVATYSPVILGTPQVSPDSAIAFNGINDGLLLPAIPISGWSTFTIEVLVKPASDGPVAPRFVHFQDSLLNRGTFEARLTPKGEWYMDTFLKNGNRDRSNKGLTLIDSSLLHRADEWYWLAMVYYGKTMSSYVNGKKELEGNIDFPPMCAGELSLGVRLNKVNWFKGCIKEMQFHHSALEASTLHRL